MTLSARLSAALAALHWGPRAFASATGVNERMVYRWLAGTYEPPAALVVWAEERAAELVAHPVPSKS